MFSNSQTLCLGCYEPFVRRFVFFCVGELEVDLLLFVCCYYVANKAEMFILPSQYILSMPVDNLSTFH